MKACSMSKRKYPYPIQNWKDEDAYKKERTRGEWAWEFLRRNESYQIQSDNYKILLEVALECTNKDECLSRRIHSCGTKNLKQIYEEFYRRNVIQKYIFSEAFKDFYGTEPEEDSFLGASIEKLLYSFGADKIKKALENFQDKEYYSADFIEFYKNQIKEKFNISEFFFYTSQYSDHLFHRNITDINYSFFHNGLFENYELRKTMSLTPESHSELVFKIDLEGNINKQLEMVRLMSQSHKKRLGIESSRKINDTLYVIYIRVLDALAFTGFDKLSKIPKGDAIEIVDAIQSLNKASTQTHNGRLNNWRTSAFKLTENGYKSLLRKVEIIED